MIARFMIRHAILRSGCVLLSAAACMAGSEDAPAERPNLPPVGLLSRATITSSDNTFEVSAAPSSIPLRGPVLIFATAFRREFLRVTHLEGAHTGYPIAIHLGSSTNDVRVIGSCGAGATGGEREWIEIPDPQHADLDTLRTVLGQALVREWRRTLPPAREARVLQDPPAWLLAGAARYAGGAHRLEDFDQVHEQWLRNRVPPLAELLFAEPDVALQHPALQAVLAGWLLDRPGGAFAALLRRLGERTPSSPMLVAETLHGKGDLAGLGREWDAWQVDALREIREVGATTPGMVHAFRSHLQLDPGDCGLPAAEAWRGRSFEECLGWPGTPEVKAALRSKAQEIRLFSAGRDGALRRVAGTYADFLDAFARGEPMEKLRAMLAQAEAGRAELEARAAKGEVLRDPVPVMTLPSDDGRKTRRPAP